MIKAIISILILAAGCSSEITFCYMQDGRVTVRQVFTICTGEDTSVHKMVSVYGIQFNTDNTTSVALGCVDKDGSDLFYNNTNFEACKAAGKPAFSKAIFDPTKVYGRRLRRLVV